MLQNLSAEVRLCYEHAEECARAARATGNEELRAVYLRLEQGWLKLARSYELGQRLTLFSQENARRANDLNRSTERVIAESADRGLAVPPTLESSDIDPDKASGHQNYLQNAVITIVDDDDSVRESLITLVGALGYRAAMFASAEEYLASGAQENTACLILDVNLPGMSGPDLYAYLVADGYCPPTVFMTGCLEEHLQKRAIDAGAFGYFNKPCNVKALIDCIEKALCATKRRRDCADLGFDEAFLNAERVPPKEK